MPISLRHTRTDARLSSPLILFGRYTLSFFFLYLIWFDDWRSFELIACCLTVQIDVSLYRIQNERVRERGRGGVISMCKEVNSNVLEKLTSRFVFRFWDYSFVGFFRFLLLLLLLFQPLKNESA